MLTKFSSQAEAKRKPSRSPSGHGVERSETSEDERRVANFSLGNSTACFRWLLPRTLIFQTLIFIIIITGCLPEEQKVLSEGEKLYRAKCTSCHRLLPIEDYPLEKFQEYIGKYGKEMTDEEKEILLQAISKLKELKR